jgi:hypothetical protein
VPDLTPGQYTLFFLYNGAARNETGKVRAARRTVNIENRDVEGLNLSLEDGISIRGSVTVEGPPAATKLEEIQVTLEPMEANRLGGGAISIENDGTFVLGDLLPDRYILRVNGEIEGKYLKSIQFAEKEVTDNTIDLGQERGALRLVFGGDPGTIRGKTGPKELVTAELASDGLLRPDQFHSTSSDEQGTFEFKDLAPGTYKVMAWEGTNVSTVETPELRKILDSKAVSVHVTANGSGSVQVTPISPAELAQAIQKLP